MPKPRPTYTLLTFLAALLASLLAVAALLVPYSLAIFAGAVLALLTFPAYESLRRRGLGPKLSAALLTLAFLAVVAGPVSYFLSRVVRQAINLGDYLSSSGLSLQDASRRLAEWLTLFPFVDNPQSVQKSIEDLARQAAGGLSVAVLERARSLPSALLQVALAMASFFFLLVDGKAFMQWCSGRIPLERHIKERIASSFQNTARSMILATLAAAFVQSVFTTLGFLALGVPTAFLAGAAVFILAWIPVVGSFPVTLAGILFLYSQGFYARTAGCVALAVFIGVADNLIKPWILKGRAALHPLLAVIAIFGGLNLWGILGIFLGPIILAIAISLLEVWPSVGREHGIDFETRRGSAGQGGRT